MDTVANCPFSNQMHKTSPDNWKVLEHDKMKLQLCMKPGKYQTQLASNRNLNAATKNKNRTTKLQHNGSTKQFSFKIYVQYIVESWKLKVESTQFSSPNSLRMHQNLYSTLSSSIINMQPPLTEHWISEIRRIVRVCIQVSHQLIMV